MGHRKAFEEMNAFLEKHPIRPVIDRAYSFENALDAFRQLEKGAFGKIVIRVFSLPLARGVPLMAIPIGYDEPDVPARMPIMRPVNMSK